MASETHDSEDLMDMDADDSLEMDDSDNYESSIVTTIDAGARRRRIEELMEEKQLHNSIFGDMEW